MAIRRCLLLKHGELFLKGDNRSSFEQRLIRHIEAALPAECGEVTVRPRTGVTVLYPQREPETLLRRMKEIPGVALIDVALRTEKSPEALVEAAIAELHRLHGEDLSGTPRSFAVVGRRRDKRYPMTSMQLAAYVGGHLQKRTGWHVNLSDPEVRVIVEVGWHESFVIVESTRGKGGLPVGSSGRAMVMLSGGYDSPVAAHRAMRRGLACDFIHFSGAPYTDPSSTYKAYALVRELTRFQPASRLWVAQLGPAQRTLASASDPALRTIAQRRLMVRIAEQLAARTGAQALISGDSLGQVASQTISNLATVEEASTLPLLRPLIGWDKDEIVAEAERIGTAGISMLPDEDCCTLLAPPRPAVRSDAQSLHKVERRAGVEDLITETVDQLQEFRFGTAETDPPTPGGTPSAAPAAATAATVAG